MFSRTRGVFLVTRKNAPSEVRFQADAGAGLICRGCSHRAECRAPAIFSCPGRGSQRATLLRRAGTHFGLIVGRWRRISGALRRLRGTAIEAGSTTWLSTPCCCRTRCSQNPSSPASWIVMIGKAWPVRASALHLRSANSVKSSATLPAVALCLDIFSPWPGDNDVTSQFDRLGYDFRKAFALARACSRGN